MASLCLHCEAPDPEVANLICVACAADATFRRMVFAEQRFLVPGEKVSLGTETRTDRAHDDWRLTSTLGVLVAPDQFGLFRRKIRLAGDGHRYLDAGEPLQCGDEFTPPTEKPTWHPLVAERVGHKVEDAHAFRRMMYATFPTEGCRCTERTPIARTEASVNVAVVAPADTPPEEIERMLADAQKADAEQVQEPSVCLKCGRVWAVQEGAQPEVEVPLPSGDAPPQACRCERVDVVEKPRIGVGPGPINSTMRDAIRRAVNKYYGGGGDTIPRVRCMDCGQVWREDVWRARNATYPDLETRDPKDALGVHPSAIERGYGPPFLRPTSPRQLEALQRLAYKHNKVRWDRFRDRGEKLFGAEAVKNIDKQFVEVDVLMQRRTTGAREAKDAKEPLLLADTDAVLALISEQLDHLQRFFDGETAEAQVKRLEYLNAKIKKDGGRPFFTFKDPEPDRLAAVQEPDWNKAVKLATDRSVVGEYVEPKTDKERKALLGVAEAIAPIVAKAKGFAKPEASETALVMFATIDGTDLKAACDEMKDAPMTPNLTRTFVVELLELISPYEIEDKSIRPKLDADYIEAVTPDRPKTQSVKSRAIPYLVLPPEMEIKRCDFWEDVDTEVTDLGPEDNRLRGWISPITGKHHKLRPCVATVGKQVPWPPSLPRKGIEYKAGDPEAAGIMLKPGETVEFGRPAVSPWRRELDEKFPEQYLAPADPYKEHRLFLAFGGKDPESEPLPGPDPDAVAEPLPKDVKFASLEDLEKVLRALYTASGMDVRSFGIDKVRKVARLILVQKDGTERAIAVPLPADVLAASS